MRAFDAHMDILPDEQLRVWRQLRPTVGLGYVLYGGTAIALRLGHRQSIDFDFFTDRALDRDELLSALPFLTLATALQDEPEALTFRTAAEGVKISFFGGIQFGRIGEPELTRDGIVQVASLEDLMATKVKVVLQRADAKDYRDIAEMIHHGVSLPNGLAAARQMFGPNFQPRESLKAMVFFEDGNLRTLSRADRETLIDAVRAVGDLTQVPLASRHLAAIGAPEKRVLTFEEEVRARSADVRSRTAKEADEHDDE
jgi:hypothetical protein